MKAPAFLNLPMQTCTLGIVELHAIDAEVVLLRDWMLCVNERQRDERSAVFLPRCQHGQFVQTRWLLNDFGNWSARYRASPQLQKIAH